MQVFSVPVPARPQPGTRILPLRSTTNLFDSMGDPVYFFTYSESQENSPAEDMRKFFLRRIVS